MPSGVVLTGCVSNKSAHSEQQQHNYLHHSTQCELLGRFRETVAALHGRSGRINGWKQTKASPWFGWVDVCAARLIVLLMPADASHEIFLELITSNHTDFSSTTMKYIFCRGVSQLLKDLIPFILSLSFQLSNSH